MTCWTYLPICPTGNTHIWNKGICLLFRPNSYRAGDHITAVLQCTH